MFGYIGTIESELKVREAASYKSWYCGLCNFSFLALLHGVIKLFVNGRSSNDF